MHLADEVVQHHLDRVEIGYNAILEGAYGNDRIGRLPHHRLGFHAHPQGAFGLGVDRHDRWFRDDDALAANVDKRVCRSEVDAKIPAEQAEQRR